MPYHQFISQDGTPYGSFETFVDGPDLRDDGVPRNYDSNGEPIQEGWYWASGHPGCLWDGEPIGPFKTEQEAIEDAQDGE